MPALHPAGDRLGTKHSRLDCRPALGEHPNQITSDNYLVNTLVWITVQERHW